MKRILLFSMLFFIAHLSFSQQPVITLGEYSKNLLGGNIFSYNEESKEIYTFDLYGKRLHLNRYDTEYHRQASSVTKIKSGLDTPYILSVRKNGSHIDVVTEEGLDIMHYTFDCNTLENTSVSLLYGNPNGKYKNFVTEVSWSSNGEYVAIVSRNKPSTEPGKQGGLKYTDYEYSIYLYDQNFHILNHISFPYMQHKVVTSKFCCPAWTLTDQGEVVYSAFHYTTKVNKYPEYGKSGCRIEVRIVTKDGVRQFNTTNVNHGGLFVKSVYRNKRIFDSILDICCSNIAKYDGEKMDIYIANVLYQYDFKSNTAKPLCRFQYYLNANSGTGLSHSFNDGNGGYAICSGRVWVWIKENPLKSRMGTWGHAAVQTDNRVFLPRIDAYSSEVTFFYNNHLYHIDNVDEVRAFRRNIYKGTQLICVDGNGSVSKLKINSNAKSDLDFYHISGTRYFVREETTRIEKEDMQRMGFFELK